MGPGPVWHTFTSFAAWKVYRHDFVHEIVITLDLQTRYNSSFNDNYFFTSSPECSDKSSRLVLVVVISSLITLQKYIDMYLHLHLPDIVQILSEIFNLICICFMFSFMLTFCNTINYFAECGLQKFEKVYFAEFHLRNVPQITP